MQTYQELHGEDAVQVGEHGTALSLHAEVVLAAVLDQGAVT